MDNTAYDNAVIEQRAHEVALEIMKMGFQARFETLETESNGDKIVPVEDLIAVYGSIPNFV